MYEGPAKSFVTGITSLLRFIKHIYYLLFISKA